MLQTPPRHHYLANLAAILAALILPVQAELVEITADGTASQTSEWNGGVYPASLAIDGNPSTFSHSDATTPNNGWELDFTDERPIARVELVMRADCCAGRLTNSTLRLFDGEGDSVFDQPLDDPGIGQTIEIDLPPSTVARRVRVGFENGATNPGRTSAIVHLGEVRVFSDVDLLPTISSFTASPQSIVGGETATLNWQTDGSDTVEISGVGVVANSGSTSGVPRNLRGVYRPGNQPTRHTDQQPRSHRGWTRSPTRHQRVHGLERRHHRPQ